MDHPSTAAQPPVKPQSRLNGFSGLFTGALLLPSSFSRLFRRPRLLFWSALIWGAAIALGAFAVTFAHSGIHSVIATTLGWVLGHPASETQDGILSWILGAILAMAGIWFFNQLTFLVAIPFSDFLAEEAERGCEPPLPAPSGPLRFRDRLRLIGLDAAKSVAASVASLLALILTWVPGAGFLSPVILALSLAFQMTSFPQTRRGLNWRDGIQFLALNLPGALGLGAVLLVTFSIPVLGALCLPAAVIAGTRFYALGRKPGQGR